MSKPSKKKAPPPGAAKQAAAPASIKPARPPTPFELRVYALCAAIPRGRVATYGGMAKALACGSAQAIGQAMRRNPWAPLPVPCHRVIGANRSIGGFSGEGSPCCAGGHVARKRAMLVEEGLRFEAEDEGKDGGYWRIASSCVLSPRETAALAPMPLQKLVAAAGAAVKKEEEEAK